VKPTATPDAKNKPEDSPAPVKGGHKETTEPATDVSGDKVYLSDATRGFEIRSKDKMYKVDRI
jgi:hypothetical protein